MTITLGAVFGPGRAFPATSQALSFGTVTAGQLVTFEVVYWNPVAVDVLTVADVTASGTATISPLSIDRQDGIQADTSVWLRTAVYSCVVRTGGTLTLTLAGLQSGAAPTVFGATFNATQGWSEVPTFRIDGAGAGAATASNGLTSWASGSATSTATSDRNSVHIGVLAWNAGVNSNLTITGGLFSSIGVENDGTSFEPGAASYLIDTTATSADASWSGVMSGAATEGASATQVIYREGQGWNKAGTGPKVVANLGHPFGAGAVESFFRGVAGGGGGVTEPLTGVSATASVGTLTPSISYTLGGNALTASVGTLRNVVSYGLTGNAVTASVGTVAPALSVSLSGVTVTPALGTLRANVSYGLSGVAAAVSVGTLTPAVSRALSGNALAASAGNLVSNVSYGLSGVSGTVSVGDLTPETGTFADLTGVQATAGVGTLTPNISYALTGVSGAVSVGTLTGSVVYDLSGVSGTVSPGSVGANVSYELSGVQITASVGTLTPVSGGDVTIALTGVQIGIEVGTLTASGGDIFVIDTHDGAPKRDRQHKKKQEERRRAIEAAINPPVPEIQAPPPNEVAQVSAKQAQSALTLDIFGEDEDDDEEVLALLVMAEEVNLGVVLDELSRRIRSIRPRGVRGR